MVARIQQRLAEAQANPGQIPYVLAANYDVSRLGNSSNCSSPDGLGFECQNFEDGRAREQLDAISPDVPIVVTAQSGHFVYVNTPALALLNICGTPGANDQCYQAVVNPEPEMALANRGQLDEDLALYAIPFFEGKVAALPQNQGLVAKLLVQAAQTYAQRGFTLVQEGQASRGDMRLYNDLLEPGQPRQAEFPVAAAMVAYDSKTGDYAATIGIALEAKEMVKDNPLLTIAAVKTFADGSPQGYTAYLVNPYQKTFFPFSDPAIFPQPYAGLPDVTQPEIERRLREAHKAGFPIIIHQIGDGAIDSAVGALLATKDAPPPRGTRDVVLHAFLVTSSQLDELDGLGTVAVSVMPPTSTSSPCRSANRSSAPSAR